MRGKSTHNFRIYALFTCFYSKDSMKFLCFPGIFHKKAWGIPFLPDMPHAPFFFSLFSLLLLPHPQQALLFSSPDIQAN